MYYYHSAAVMVIMAVMHYHNRRTAWWRRTTQMKVYVWQRRAWRRWRQLCFGLGLTYGKQQNKSDKQCS
jgi:hypothetical protein